MDEVELILQAQQGDEHAKTLLLDKYRPKLIHYIARKWAMNLDQFEDMAQEGAVGFLEAIDTYDPNKGSTILPHAYSVVYRRIADYHRTMSGAAKLGERAVRKLRNNLIAENENIDGWEQDDELRRWSGLMNYAPLDTSWSMADTLFMEPENVAITRGDDESVRNMLDCLDDFDRECVMMKFGFYGLPMTYGEVADATGVSRRAVSYRIQKSMRKLRALV